MKSIELKKNFLHSHPMMQKDLGAPDGHIIVDRKDWLQAMRIVEYWQEVMRILK